MVLVTNTTRLRELLAAAEPHGRGPFRVGVGGVDDGRRTIRPETVSPAGLVVFEVQNLGHPAGAWESVFAKTPQLAVLIAEGLSALPGLLDDLETLRALEPEVRTAQRTTEVLRIRAEAAEAKVRELLELHGGPELEEEVDLDAELRRQGLPEDWNDETPNGRRET